MGGSKGSTGTTSSNQTSTVSIPPEVLARYNSVNAQAQDVAQTPFQPYTGEFVAPVNPTQQGGINQIAGAANWINPTYSNTVGAISAGLGAAQPQYNSASGNINAGLAGGNNANVTALGQYSGALGQAQPYNTAAGGLYGAATGLAGAGTQAVNPTALDSNAIGQYMSPYNSAVVQATMAQLQQQQAMQQNSLKTQQILGGSFGGDRSGIDSAVLANQQGLTTASTIAGLNNQNYSQALGAAQQQQGVGLGAAQANRAAIQQGAGQLTNLGQATQGLGQQVYGQGTGQAAFTGQIGQQGYQQALGAAGAQTSLGQAQFGTDLAAAQGYGQAGAQALSGQLAQGQAQLGAGTLQQQTQQAQDTANYNQFLQQQAYPFQTTQFLANIAEGTGALSGSTTSAAANQFTPQPFFSDRRLKENIKRIGTSSAGIPIVRYNYKGSPHTQIGMIAQDVEKKRPDAVGLAAGYKTVDYDRATRARGGLAGGGPATVIYHIGGSVDDMDAGRGFADGGMPGADPIAMAQMLAAQQAMYPGAAGRQGMGGEGPRGVQVPQSGSHQLMKAELMKLPEHQQQQSGLQESLKDVSAAAGAGRDAKSLYGMGKEIAVGTPGKGTAAVGAPGQPGYAPASSDYQSPTSGLAGSGGKWDPSTGALGGASNSNTPPIAAPAPADMSSAASGAGTLVADAARDSSSNLLDSALDLAWRGGRMKRYASGGMPYGEEGVGYVPEDDFQPTDPLKLEKEQKDMSPSLMQPPKSSGSGGGGENVLGDVAGVLGTAAKIVPFFLDRGGRAGYQDGGDPTLPDYNNVVPDNVIPFKKPGLNPEPKALDLPKREAKADEPYKPEDIDTGGTGKYVDQRPAPAPGLGAAPAPAPAAAASAPTPGLAPASAPMAPPPAPAPPVDNWGRMIGQESGGQQFRNGQPITSSAGARGIAQVMPTTGPVAAKLAGVPWNPELFNRGQTGDRIKDEEAKTYNLQLGRAYYDDQLKTFGDPNIASAAYNAGPDAVRKAQAMAQKTGQSYLNYLPKETQDYVRIVSGQGGPSPGRGLAGGAAGPAAAGLPGGGLGAALSDAGDWLGNAASKTGEWIDRHEKPIVSGLAFLGSMLSSPSRTFAGALGSGLVGGAKAYAGQQEIGQGQTGLEQGQQRVDISRQQLGITQNAQYISLLTQMRAAQAARQQQGLPPDPVLDGQVQALMTKISQGVSGAGAGASPVNSPAGGGAAPTAAPQPQLAGSPPTPIGTTPLPAPATPAPVTPPAATSEPSKGGEPGKPESWGPVPSLNLAAVSDKIDPDFNPRVLNERAKQVAATNAPNAPEIAAQLNARASQYQQQMEEHGTLPGKDGGSVSIPGYQERKTADDNRVRNQKTLEEDTAAAKARPQVRMLLDQLKDLSQSYETGAGTEFQAKAQQTAKAFGIDLPNATGSMSAQQFQEFQKNAYAQILNSASMNKDETDRLRGLVGKTFASTELQPGANRTILAETEAALNHADKRTREFANDANAAQHLPQSQWFQKWNDRPENNMNNMVKEARKNIPVIGDVPSKRTDLEEGSQYVLRPNDAVKLFANPNKAGATAEDIRKQFGDKKSMRVVIKKDANGNLVPYPVQ